MRTLEEPHDFVFWHRALVRPGVQPAGGLPTKREGDDVREYPPKIPGCRAETTPEGETQTPPGNQGGGSSVPFTLATLV